VRSPEFGAFCCLIENVEKLGGVVEVNPAGCKPPFALSVGSLATASVRRAASVLILSRIASSMNLVKGMPGGQKPVLPDDEPHR